MEASVYIDVLFFITWGMQSFLLWMAGRFAGFRAKKWRLLMGGFLSAMLYCLWLWVFRRNGGILLSFLLLLCGLGAAYLPKQWKNFLRLFFAAWGASFLLGGGIAVLFTLTQSQRLLGEGLILRQNNLYPWQLLLWAIAMAYILMRATAKWVEAHIQRRREFCSVVIFWRGRRAEGRVLIDTGNGLRQEDGRGVVVLESAAVRSLFSPEEQMALLSGERRGLALESLAFTSLGNPDGRLWGIRAERLELFFGEQTICHKDIFVGISFEGFTGAYEGLTPPCLLEEA
ncbi:MAG: sigma-E processing peptidase SpoIIGA [Anaerotignum sp.]|nr:sigma-E processing peptidase SpoIIGA [Anaerotignum sp.]